MTTKQVTFDYPDKVSVFSVSEVAREWRRLIVESYSYWLFKKSNLREKDLSERLSKLIDYCSENIFDGDREIADRYIKYYTKAERQPPPPLGVIGYPGQAKTSLFRAQVRHFCEKMGLDLLHNPGDESLAIKDGDWNKNAYVVFTPNLTGYADAKIINGIFSLDARGEGKSTTLPQLRIMNHLPGFLFFDDLRNSLEHVQAALHNLFDEQRQVGQDMRLDHVGVGFTGNFGERDRSAAREGSVPFFGRVRIIVQEFLLDDFIDYIMTHSNFEGRDIYAAFINRFKEIKPEMFNETLDAGDDVIARHGTPRLWTIGFNNIDFYISELLLQASRDQEYDQNLVKNVRKGLESAVGSHNAEEFCSYLKGFLRSLHDLSFVVTSMNTGIRLKQFFTNAQKVADSFKENNLDDVASTMVYRIGYMIDKETNLSIVANAMSFALLISMAAHGRLNHTIINRFARYFMDNRIKDDPQRTREWMTEMKRALDEIESYYKESESNNSKGSYPWFNKSVIESFVKDFIDTLKRGGVSEGILEGHKGALL